MRFSLKHLKKSDLFSASSTCDGSHRSVYGCDLSFPDHVKTCFFCFLCGRSVWTPADRGFASGFFTVWSYWRSPFLLLSPLSELSTIGWFNKNLYPATDPSSVCAWKNCYSQRNAVVELKMEQIAVYMQQVGNRSAKFHTFPLVNS